MTGEAINFKFLLDQQARSKVRTAALIIYFLLFQVLILLQKPFLQVDFIFSFYLAFIGIFTHHLYLHFFSTPPKGKSLRPFFSYAMDFGILVLFMRSFPQLSSFLLVIELFLLFLASFDLEFIQLCGLGLLASFGISIMNLTIMQTGSVQNILTLALFNLSYLAVIIVSGQLKSEIFNIQSDLTRVQKKSKSQAEFAKVLLEKIPLGLIVSEKNKSLLMQNTFVQDSLLLGAEEIQQLLGQSQNQASSADIHFVLRSNSEKRIFQIDKTNYFDEEINDQLTISLVRDVTDLRRLEEQLKQKEKLAAIGQLAAGIAHEIRNPLAGISGSVQMLSSEAYDTDQLKLMKIILKEIDRLNNLITEFLEYAKPEKRPDQIVELSLVLEEVIQNVKLSPNLLKDLTWNVRLNSQKILGFSEKLKQSFLNIIINAIQAMETTPSPQLDISISSDEDCVIVFIKDNGQGMKPETKKRLFEPFHTTKIKGTGLGLAVTHKILDSHGAVVEVDSEVGYGTEFIIKFPKLGH